MRSRTSSRWRSPAQTLPSVRIEMVLRGVCERTGWAIGQAWVLSPDGRTLVCSPAWHAATAGLASFRRVTEALSFVPGIGLPGKAWESARAVWIRDVRSDPGFERGLFAQAVGLAGGVAVPVMAEEEVVAVIEFFVFEQREEDERLVALVSAVAAQVGHPDRAQARRGGAAPEREALSRGRGLGRGCDRVGGRAGQRRVCERGRRADLRPAGRRRGRWPSGAAAGQAGADGSRTAAAAVVSTTGRGPDGEEIPLEAAFSRWSEGEDRFTTAVLRDVTDRRRADAIVQEAEERFRGAFEHAPIGMALVSIEHDRAGCFLRVNRALCELIGQVRGGAGGARAGGDRRSRRGVRLGRAVRAVDAGRRGARVRGRAAPGARRRGAADVAGVRVARARRARSARCT